MRKILAILFIFILFTSVANAQLRVESEQTYIALTPSELTAYKGLSFLSGDSMAISKGSAVGDSMSVSETLDSNNGTLEFWYYPYNYGNAGQIRYLFDAYVDANNRISIYVNASNNLVFDVIGAGTTRTASTSFSAILPFSWNHIVGTWSKNVAVNGANYSYVYLNGSGAGQTSATVAMASIPSSFYIGSDYNGLNSANGLIAYKVSDYWTIATQVVLNYNSGDGNANFVVRDAHTVAMGLTSESSTGVVYSHKGQAIQSISTVTLTLVNTIGGRGWADGDRVVVWDDAATPNVVVTTINGAPSGSTIVVDDSCAAVTGTNKFISKNLIVDANGELSTANAWASSGATLSKNATNPISGNRELKAVNDGAASGYARQTIPTAASEDYAITAQAKALGLPSEASTLVNVDGTAAMSTTVSQNLFQGGDTLGSSLNCAGAYYASAADNTKLQVTTEDICISVWVKMNIVASTNPSIIVGKGVTGGNYRFYIRTNDNGFAYLGIDDGDTYLIRNNTDLRDNKWHYVVGIIDRDTEANCKIFIDGVDVTYNRGGALANVTNLTNANIFQMGAITSNWIHNGSIADVKIYIAAGATWSDAQVLYQYLHPYDISASAGTITEAYACSKGSTTTIPGRITTPGNDLTLSNALAWENQVKEIEFCTQAKDTSTTFDLCVPSVTASDYISYDNERMVSSLVVNGGCEDASSKYTTAKTDFVRVNAYGLNAVGGTGNSGKGETVAREFLITGQKYRIRQSGTIKQVKLYIANISHLTGFYICVWRKDGATYDRIGISENIVGSLTPTSINTITLSSPIAGVIESDYIGYKMTGDGVSEYQLYSSTTGQSNTWYLFNSEQGDTDIDWESTRNVQRTNDWATMELYMEAPVIVGIGDSIMAGHPLHYSYCETTATNAPTIQILNKIGSYSYQNMGIGSQTTTQISSRFTNDVVNLKPRIAVIEGGGNDTVSWNTETYIANMTTMINACKTNDITPIVLMILPATSGDTTAMQNEDAGNLALKALCTTLGGVVLIDPRPIVGQFRVGGDAGNYWDMQAAYNSGDDVHYNEAGHTAIGALISSVIDVLPFLAEPRATVELDTSPHAGVNCLKVTAGADNVGASQAVTLVDDTYYTISGWVRVTAGDSAQIIVDTGDGTLLTVGTVTATTWQKISISFKSTGTSGNIYLRAVTDTDVVWFDDVSMIRDDVGTVAATKGDGTIPSNQPPIRR